jgi:DNA-binding winged helix-turn-helix (wHTH) protein
MRFEFGEFCYDTNQLQLFRHDEPVHLTPKAMALLELLINNRPAVVRHEQLFDCLWPDVVVHHANLKNLVGDLRRALDDHRRQGRFIRAVHGRGYAFTGKVREVREERAHAPSSVVLVDGVKRVTLPQGETIIGRGGDASIHLDSPSVSRHHAKMTVEGERVTVEDLGSRNGTLVNGLRIYAPIELRHGDEVRFGLLTFLLSVGLSSEPDTLAFEDDYPTPHEIRIQ